MQILAIRYFTRSLQFTGKWVFKEGTDIQTLQLIDWIGPVGQLSENVVSDLKLDTLDPA